MGQKIRIENGQPVIIDRKERASLTPIGSLASWGGSSGGMVVKAVDDGIVPQLPSNRKRKPKAPKQSATAAATAAHHANGNAFADSFMSNSPTLVAPPPPKIPHILGQHHLELTAAAAAAAVESAHQLEGGSPLNHQLQVAAPPPLAQVPTSNSSSSPKSSISDQQMVKDTLMPKETCPVCGILITYKNLARHIKLRHKIKYKFCHR